MFILDIRFEEFMSVELYLECNLLNNFIFQKGASQYRNTINKALDFIAKKLPEVEDPYAISLCAYALHRANHAQKDAAFNLLEGKAKTNAEMRWWEKVPEKGDEKNPWPKTITNGVNIEMSAYALMTYLERGLDTDSLPNLRWIVAQRNANGGFVSTQVSNHKSGLPKIQQYFLIIVRDPSTGSLVNITQLNKQTKIFVTLYISADFYNFKHTVYEYIHESTELALVFMILVYL